MGKKVLFSPVGGTDPIAENNIHDGSLLHICRVYKVDEVYMYLSKEMIEKHNQDNRYVLSLEKLAAHQKRHISCKLIERPELEDVQKFDTFYQEFREILSGIVKNLDDKDELIINISSGTPAMKSSLVVLCTLGEIPATMVQVSTPEKRLNNHYHSAQYDIETLWELNEDNNEPFINRCDEIKCPTLSDMMKKEIITKHILVYDYQAAISVSETLINKPESFMDSLYMAADRYLLKKSIDQYIKKRLDFSLPVVNGKYRDAFEYALVMSLKLRRGEFCDFIRSITPLMVDLYDMILEKQFHIKVDDYCLKKHLKRIDHEDLEKKDTNQWTRQWDMNKLYSTNILTVLNNAYNGNFMGKEVYSEHLMYIILGYVSDPVLRSLVIKLRSVEYNCRNQAAHEIMSVSEETISDLTGFSGKRIMQMIQQLFAYTGANVKEEYWDSYDRMNEMLLRKLNE